MLLKTLPVLTVVIFPSLNASCVPAVAFPYVHLRPSVPTYCVPPLCRSPERALGKGGREKGSQLTHSSAHSLV